MVSENAFVYSIGLLCTHTDWWTLSLLLCRILAKCKHIHGFRKCFCLFYRIALYTDWWTFCYVHQSVCVQSNPIESSCTYILLSQLVIAIHRYSGRQGLFSVDNVLFYTAQTWLADSWFKQSPYTTAIVLKLVMAWPKDHMHADIDVASM